MAKGTNIPPLGEKGFNYFNPFKFPGINMEIFLRSYQNNMEFLNASQQIAIETTKSLIEIQNQYVKKLFNQWNEQVKTRPFQSPLHEKTAFPAEAAKEAVEQTLEHLGELNSILVKSNEKMNESIKKRFKEGLDESLNVVEKGKGKGKNK